MLLGLQVLRLEEDILLSTQPRVEEVDWLIGARMKELLDQLGILKRRQG